MKPSSLPPVLYEDEFFLAFDKPSGLLSAPDRFDKNKAHLIGWVHSHLSPDYFNAHRLDKDTSGVFLCAKTKDALEVLTLLFEKREVGKKYLALTRGSPPEKQGIISAPLDPHPGKPGLMCVRREGKESVTEYEVLENWKRGITLLRLTPKTGRTHQIRVHLAYLGCPVLGDPFYGDGRPLLLSELKAGYKPGSAEEKPLLGRLALHAETLSFVHPVQKQLTSIHSPIPEDFQLALKKLRQFG